ncbi:Pkinase-domain-containing protein [Auriscalpium vulgare]|uniref:Pkinase-domain-containing protein n=1 Tax=Auriscalpium vulgare TaxID=40419 RepID=A0ACB8S9K1_9AGAM|nr:Pkinase-domain-containing protein [Auriscalpium vulgare]
MDSLQIPDTSLPGPSRQNGVSRPASVSVHPTPIAPPSQPASRKRASHNVTTSSQAEERPAYTDIYSHPAAQQYAASHPRRTIPRFGPYLLLQTLGEGEFGKVKLGLHTAYGEEVAVKLIKRHNIDSAVRMSKVEREIEVLRMLKHPNIVRLYDVIETDKYIGIILDYASGGELFDHILAHRYLKEKDACKLFSQLVSGVWYIHQRKIVHRDLKLENLLLDRNRNVIITDFGFANRFEHRTDDLMQTSCGSPCYAAPELVISEGSYVGSAVDIWSCGVILYAMLAGYLPFDDDPANPDGDNINLLYKYIVNTPLSFPDYISPEGRDLLSIMLQPDPKRRAGLAEIMQHPWLAPYAYLFDKTVDELETTAVELHRQKRLAYQRQMRSAQTADVSTKVSRSQSARTDVFPHASVGVPPSSTRSRSHRDQQYQSPTDQPEYLYETSADQSSYVASPTTVQPSRRGVVNSAIVLPTSAHALDDDPFAPSPTSKEVPPILPVPPPAADRIVSEAPRDAPLKPMIESPKVARSNSTKKDSIPPPVIPSMNGASQTGSVRSKGGMRHTIQVEYGQPDADENALTALSPPPRPPKKDDLIGSSPSSRRAAPEQTRRPSTGSQRIPPSPVIPIRQPQPPKIETLPPVVTINAASPPDTPRAVDEKTSYMQPGSASNDSTSSKQSRHRKGLSLDKIGLGKLFGTVSPEPPSATSGMGSRVPSESSATNATGSLYTTISRMSSNRRPSTVQVTPSASTHGAEFTPQAPLLSPTSPEPTTNGASKSRRSTLSVMVEPLTRTIKSRPRGRDPETPFRGEKARDFSEKPPRSATTPTIAPTKEVDTSQFAKVRDEPSGNGLAASSNKARKVMQWFRSRSKGPAIDDEDSALLPPPPDPRRKPTAMEAFQRNGSSASVQMPTPVTETPVRAHPQRSASQVTESSAAFQPSFAERMKRHVAPPKGVMRVHHGAVDQTMITTSPPPEVMRNVRETLERMGIEIQIESEYKFRCVRGKKRRAPGIGLGLRDASASTGNGLAAFMMVGSAASNGVDKRGLPVPSQTFGGATGGMLKGLLMRRQSSQVSTGSPPTLYDEPEQPVASTSNGSLDANGSGPGSGIEPVYGDPVQDLGDEVRFYVELTRMDRLNDTFSLDIRRLKGNLRSYKFLYDTLRERVNLQR